MMFLTIFLGLSLQITGKILAQQDTEQKPSESETQPETNRGLPSPGSSKNFSNPNIISPSESPTAPDNSNDNPFAPSVVRGTPRRSSPSDIVKTLENDNKFQTLISILDLADLGSELEKPGFFVLFAPTEAAFDRLTTDFYSQLILPENRGQLIEFIRNHFVIETIEKADLDQGEIKTISGRVVRVNIDPNGEIQLNEAKVKMGEFIQTQNGLIVPVDQVLFAPSLNIETSTTNN